jgi:hypothetical protein
MSFLHIAHLSHCYIMKLEIHRTLVRKAFTRILMPYGTLTDNTLRDEPCANSHPIHPTCHVWCLLSRGTRGASKRMRWVGFEEARARCPICNSRRSVCLRLIAPRTPKEWRFVYYHVCLDPGCGQEVSLTASLTRSTFRGWVLQLSAQIFVRDWPALGHRVAK